MSAVVERWSATDARVRRRLVSAVLLLGTGAVLGTALWLTPSAEGHGTHLQLGLNQCSMLSATGYPCPMCGATTTFTLWAHLRPLEGLVNQPFASVLFLMTAGTFALSLTELIDPRGRWARLIGVLAPYDIVLSLIFMALMGAGWVYKAWLMGTLG